MYIKINFHDLHNFLIVKIWFMLITRSQWSGANGATAKEQRQMSNGKGAKAVGEKTKHRCKFRTFNKFVSKLQKDENPNLETGFDAFLENTHGS